jgi:hypothetical protein
MKLGELSKGGIPKGRLVEIGGRFSNWSRLDRSRGCGNESRGEFSLGSEDLTNRLSSRDLSGVRLGVRVLAGSWTRGSLEKVISLSGSVFLRGLGVNNTNRP